MKFPSRKCETVPRILGVLEAAWDAYTKEHKKEPEVIVMPFWALMSYGKYLGEDEASCATMEGYATGEWERTLCFHGVPVTAPFKKDAEKWENVLWVASESEK